MTKQERSLYQRLARWARVQFATLPYDIDGLGQIDYDRKDTGSMSSMPRKQHRAEASRALANRLKVASQ